MLARHTACAALVVNLQLGHDDRQMLGLLLDGTRTLADIASSCQAALVEVYRLGLLLLMLRHVQVSARDPVDLADLLTEPTTTATIAAATDRIMAAVTGLVAELRGETPPAERYDPRKTGVHQIGNPRKKERP